MTALLTSLLSALSLLLSLVLIGIGVALLVLIFIFLWSVPNYLKSIALSLEEMNYSQKSNSLKNENDDTDESKYYS